jgi:hypothetical protein
LVVDAEGRSYVHIELVLKKTTGPALFAGAEFGLGAC